MFLVGSSACVVESIGPLNITTLGRRGPDLGTVRAARRTRPSRRRRLEPANPTAFVEQIFRPTPPLPEHRSAIQRTPGVSTSSSSRGLTSWFCASVPGVQQGDPRRVKYLAICPQMSVLPAQRNTH